MKGFDVLVQLAADIAAAVRAVLEGPHLTGVGIWLFGLVFLWAGASKAQRPTVTALSLVDFELTREVRPWLGLALGLGEMALAGWLISGLASRAALAAAALVLLIFSAGIAGLLRAGKQVACMCFGDASTTVSRRTLARTLGLAVAAGGLAVAWQPTVTRASGQGLLEALIATALVATVVLVSKLPRLLRWNPLPPIVESEVHT